MTNASPGLLEQIALDTKRQADALEGILEAITNFKFEQVGNIAVAGVQAQEEPDAGTDHETSTEEAEAQKAEVQKEEEDTSEPEPKPKPEEESDKSGETVEEAGGENSDEGDPLGDGTPANDDPYPLPEKLSNDTLRGFARQVMQKQGKSVVFEVLAAVGSGYKAVGEVSKDDLQEAHKLMVERLRG